MRTNVAAAAAADAADAAGAQSGGIDFFKGR